MIMAKLDLVPQNMGLIDRTVRIIVGCLMLGVPYFFITTGAVELVTPLLAWTMALSIYPLITAIIGWDPFYALSNKKTCGFSERNQCGSVPYQVDAALGNHPIPDSDEEHELINAHHEHR